MKRHTPMSQSKRPAKLMKKTPEALEPKNEMEHRFVRYAQFFDDRNDRKERIYKATRDVTAESKKAIFLLQRIPGSTNKDGLIDEAKQKLEDVVALIQTSVIPELRNKDDFWRFQNSFSFGLQEFIEGLTFFHYLASESVPSLVEVREWVARKPTPAEGETDVSAPSADVAMSEATPHPDVNTAIASEPVPAESAEKTAAERAKISASSDSLPVPFTILYHDYILGLADLTGELMRLALSSVNNPQVTFKIMDTISTLYDIFRVLPRNGGGSMRDLEKKVTAMKESLEKVEKVCYALRVRGAEYGNSQFFLDSIVNDDQNTAMNPED
eukprot:TRINITY_DN5793_c0_g1::TRINITY_DN5793_c0_g1_i1::g.14610::m.14610 TRINITY_DN5793_c0_g1::TRINITY_DN5793_c0_g1_i1::g.14610  ORF type:complete len:327 (+),score=41.64,sp/Q9QZE7/TSNAX_MOUSE/32.72/7e-34,Translin/PF01997.11/1.6e-47,DUF4200/PF13863.1/1.7,DUF4200/PF13863.1/1.3e+02 TRINITY_DN5793_c0_g1_i1:76-1056(+)